MSEYQLRKCQQCGITVWASKSCPICPELANRYQIVTPNRGVTLSEILDSLTRLSDPASGSPSGSSSSAPGRIEGRQPEQQLSTAPLWIGDNYAHD